MLQRLCRFILKLAGWHIDIRLPKEKRYVLIGYPHTSNQDFMLAMLVKGALGVRFRFVAKHTLFWWPLGVLMRALGGIAVDRRVSTGFITQLVALYQQAKSSDAECIIGMMPEGTRSYRSEWKSGFYYLAVQADVPVVPAYLDFSTKTIGLGDPIYLSGEVESDLQQFHNFYSKVRGRYHHRAAPIKFKSR